MRTIPIPVDTRKLTITCVKAPRPRLLNKDTGEIKTDKNGNTVYEVTVSVEDESGRIELVRIGIAGEPSITPGDQINAVDLVGYVWEMSGRWGISYRASALLPARETADA
ncbi:SCO3933 family regulatory protein [Nonomuraea sp. 10N515B]|uniref:SCO3933 family regulatory protein n=1 Tax=Nonomuraea sp. 10N515B TaxID=3457422 RepID=UPI003FCCC56C